jgi:hypothetical protein
MQPRQLPRQAQQPRTKMLPSSWSVPLSCLFSSVCFCVLWTTQIHHQSHLWRINERQGTFPRKFKISSQGRVAPEQLPPSLATTCHACPRCLYASRCSRCGIIDTQHLAVLSRRAEVSAFETLQCMSDETVNHPHCMQAHPPPNPRWLPGFTCCSHTLHTLTRNTLHILTHHTHLTRVGSQGSLAAPRDIHFTH